MDADDPFALTVTAVFPSVLPPRISNRSGSFLTTKDVPTAPACVRIFAMAGSATWMVPDFPFWTLIEPLPFRRISSDVWGLICGGPVTGAEGGFPPRTRRDWEFGALSGESASIRALAASIARAAETASPVLVTGEAGAGKRTVARAIHTQSDRESGPFVELLAQGYDHATQERELRGWVTGAVPGGLPERAGRIELSYGGTLLIEEIGALGPAAQRALARALEGGLVERVGAESPLHVPSRIVATTTDDLPAKVAAGTFDQGLYDRLSVCNVRVPSLRERIEDLPALAEHTLLRLARRSPRVPRRLSLEAHAALAKYGFPGNVRELANVLERAAIHCRGDVIEASHLELGIVRAPTVSSVPLPTPSAPLSAVQGSVADGTAQRIDLDGKLEEVERRELLAALERCHGNKAEVARVLGVQRTTLYYRLKKLGIDV